MRRRSAWNRVLAATEARLVAWLVRNHLILSITSQKKDISDPDIIHDFARRVGDQAHLDYLYVLSVADVRGTNPNSGTPGRRGCSRSSTSAPSAPCAAAWKLRSIRTS